MKSETYEYICAVYALARKVCYSMNAQARRLPVKAFQAGRFVGWRARRVCAFANGSSYVPCNKPISCVQQYLPCECFFIVHPKLHWNLNVFHWKYIPFAFSLLRSLNATSALYILYKSKGAWLLWYADAPHYNAIIYTRLNLDSSHPCWRTRAHQWSSIKHTCTQWLRRRNISHANWFVIPVYVGMFDGGIYGAARVMLLLVGNRFNWFD